MKRTLKAFAAVALSMSMVACAGSTTEPTTTGISGTFEGTGTGKNGEIKLNVTFNNNKIETIEVVEQNETAGISDPAFETIPSKIVENQSTKVDAVAGATMSSNGIIAAVESAITSAGLDVSDYQGEVTVTKSEDQTLDTDIVVVGAGAAGLMAAYQASLEGLNVVVLEKGASASVSNFALCGGPAAVETNIQAAEDATVTVEQYYDHLYEFAKGTVNAKALKETVKGTTDAVNLLDDLGIEMILMQDTYGVGYRARHYILPEGADRVNPVIEKIEAQGAKFYFSTPGKEIIMENGKAVGVKAEAADGSTLTVNAKAVLIATGGFLGSEEMIHQVYGNINVVPLGNTLSTADGINMVLAAGGSLANNFALLGNEVGGANSKMKDPIFNEDWTLGNDNLIYWLTGGLIVDPSGDRFMNEKLIADTPLATGGQALAQVGKAYAVVDQKYYDANYETGIYAYMSEPENWIAGAELAPTNKEKADEYLEKAISEGWGFKANSIEELAEITGLENLVSTVESYNEMCEAGEDTEFGKASNFMIPVNEGPFYVFEYEPSAWGTDGGVKVDSHLRALTSDFNAIEGLYVAGVDAGSLYATPYYDSEGSSVGIAMGSGIYAGKEMAAFVKGNE